MHAIIICKNNTVFAKSDFWSKIEQHKFANIDVRGNNIDIMFHWCSLGSRIRVADF